MIATPAFSGRVLVTGAHGQLGRELSATCPEGVRLCVHDIDTLDITDAEAVARAVGRFAPEVIVNAAAYTAVDKAQSDAERAQAVNAEAVAHLAQAAYVEGARLVQVSTDFVFDGQQGRPYRPEDAAAPLGVYGQTKYEGECAALDILGEQALIVRTAWVYSQYGQNFVKTMLRLMSEREHLGVVADQVGTPTWARGLAQALWQAVALKLSGRHHWTDAGVASWYDFALAIRDEALARGLLERSIPVHPLRTEDYPTPARRPSYSVLDKTATWAALGVTPVHWRESLRAMLAQLA